MYGCSVFKAMLHALRSMIKDKICQVISKKQTPTISSKETPQFPLTFLSWG